MDHESTHGMLMGHGSTPSMLWITKPSPSMLRITNPLFRGDTLGFGKNIQGQNFRKNLDHEKPGEWDPQKKYFTSSDPHHGIQFIPSDNLSGISIWHSIWHIFWHFIWHIFWHSIWHSFWHRSWGPAANTGRLWSWLRSGSEHWAWLVVVEVRQRKLGVAGRGWGPAANTGRGWSWLRSGSERWAWMVVVEVRQRTLGVAGRGWGPAANTGRGPWPCKSSKFSCSSDLL